jgi:acyl-CoA thioester hydrolase
MSEPLLTYRGVVYPWHCDHMGHMNVMWYVGKFDEATWQLLSLMGFTPDYLRTNNRGMVAVEQQTSYKSELHAGDLISIYSQVLEIKDKSIRFSHEMKKQESDEVVATTTLTGVHIDALARKSCSIPAEIKTRASALIGM